MYDLGSRIKAARMQRGLTQREMAQRINKSVAAVSSYETNAQLPPLEVVESICQVLNISSDYLIGRNNEESLLIHHLTHKQKQILNMIYTEFTNPSKTYGQLSPRQSEIISQILFAFTENNL